MKPAAVLIAATFAVASANDPTCDSAALLKIVQSESGQACTASTGLSIAAAKPVTAENAAQVCTEKSCQRVFKEVTDIVKTEFLLLGVTPLIAGVLKPTEVACTKLADSPPACDSAFLLKVVQSDNAKACTAKTGFSIAAAKAGDR